MWNSCIIEGKKVMINSAAIRGIRKGKTANDILFKDKLVISLIINIIALKMIHA